MHILKRVTVLNPFLLILSLCLLLISQTSAAVTLSVNGLKATISNSLIEINFNSDATVKTCYVNGTNIASTTEKTFYLDWNDNGAADFDPSKLVVVQNTSAIGHFYYLQDKSGVFRIEFHYVLQDGVSGIYSYAKYTNNENQNIGFGETRTVYRFNYSILLQGYNYVRLGTLPTYSFLDTQTKIQDETWQFSNGTYYTKYDYAGYIRETPYQGVLGNGYGAFVISPSREYHNGGPLKQDLLVHQNSLITNYFLSAHFGTAPGLSAPPGWTHMYGPWLVYFPTGRDSSILEDVDNRYKIEQSLWPYGFVDDDEYPLQRGVITGSINGQTKAEVVLYDSISENFDQQSQGYLYNTQTDENGNFTLRNVRPGKYRLLAYPLAGQGSENLVQQDVTVTQGTTHTISILELVEPTNIIWSLGDANRRSSEFKYSDQGRNYLFETLPPANLSFIIGQSKPQNDWYYAQIKPGTWTINYQDTQDGQSRILRIAIAAASTNPHLIASVNGHKVGDIYFDNDSSVYRSAMQSGRFYSNVLTVDATQVVDGKNVLTLQISHGQVMYDAISLARNKTENK